MSLSKTKKLTLKDLLGGANEKDLMEVPYLVQGRSNNENFFSHVKRHNSKGLLLGDLFKVGIPSAISDFLALAYNTPMYNQSKEFNLVEHYAERCARQMHKIIKFWAKNPCSDQKEYREAVTSLCKEFVEKYPEGKLAGHNPFVLINEVVSIHSVAVIGPSQFMADQKDNIDGIYRQLNQKRLVQEMIGELMRTLIWAGLDAQAKVVYRENLKQEKVLVDFYTVYPFAVLPEQRSTHVPPRVITALKQDVETRPDGYMILGEISRYLHESVRDGAHEKRPFNNGYSSLFHLLQSSRVVSNYLERFAFDADGNLKFPEDDDEDLYTKMNIKPMMMHNFVAFAQEINKTIAAKNIKYNKVNKRKAEARPSKMIESLLTFLGTAAVANSKEMKQATGFMENAIGNDTAYDLASIYLLQLISLMSDDLSHGQLFAHQENGNLLKGTSFD